MQMTSEQALNFYANAYQKLYKRIPRELRAVDHEWVIVNGARMRVDELEYITQQLEFEYNQTMAQKKNLVKRLLNFFKQ
jgi:hypothetical protein